MLNRQHLSLIIASLFAHIALIALLNTRVSVPFSENVKAPSDTIQAHLVMLKPKSEPKIQEQETSKEPDHRQQPNVLDEQKSENLQNESQDIEKTLPVSVEPPIKDFEQKTPETPKENLLTEPSAATSLIQKHRQRIQHSDDQAFLDKEIADYGATRSFSVMHAQPNNAVEHSMAPVKIEVAPPITVDCSSKAAQITTLLTGLLGGRLSCSAPPPLTPHLEKRLKKRGLSLEKVKNRK